VVHHAHELGPAAFVRQHFNYGRGAFHFHRHRASRPPWSFYRDLVRHFMAQETGLGAYRQAALALLMQAATAVGFLAEGASAHIRSG
jgi:hypothetical protein